MWLHRSDVTFTIQRRKKWEYWKNFLAKCRNLARRWTRLCINSKIRFKRAHLLYQLWVGESYTQFSKQTTHVSRMAGSDWQPPPLTDISQYATSPGRRVHYYAELAVSSPAVAETIASTHCTNQRGMARLSCPEWPGSVSSSEHFNAKLVPGGFYIESILIYIFKMFYWSPAEAEPRGWRSRTLRFRGEPVESHSSGPDMKNWSVGHGSWVTASDKITAQ